MASEAQLDTKAEAEPESASASQETMAAKQTQRDLVHPWPCQAQFFAIRAVCGHTYRLQCLLCLPKVTECSAYFNSPSNLKKKHVDRVHPAHKEEYEKSVAAGRKRKGDSIVGNAEKPLKQPKIEATIRSANTVTQKQVNTAIVNYVIGAVMPLSVVEVQEFKDLITTLQPGRHAMSRNTLRGLIVAEATTMKNKLVELLTEQDFVATTTNCWSAYGKSYLGVTVHWIANDTLQRKSAYLALRRMKGSHTYDAIASALDDVHAEFGIWRKILRTTTENGSNFVKAFTVYATRSHEPMTMTLYMKTTKMTWTAPRGSQWTSTRH